MPMSIFASGRPCRRSRQSWKMRNIATIGSSATAISAIYSGIAEINAEPISRVSANAAALTPAVASLSL